MLDNRSREQREVDRLHELQRELADAQATIAALQARVKELEESRDAWKASQECSEKAYMALVNQIPAERFDFDPVNVALLDGAKEQEIIGRKQIADLQDLLKRADENRGQWRKLCQEAQSQLTQRTAELTQLDRTLADVYAQRDGLQKDLAQRTAELEAANGSIEAARRVNNDLQAELERVRGLVKALPKVEGEIYEAVASYRYDKAPEAWFHCESQLIALLQHRQGMEG